MNEEDVMSNEAQNITQGNYREILSSRWMEYLHALGTVEGTWHWRCFRDGQPEGGSKDEFVCLYPLFREGKIPTETSTFAEVYNSRYFFTLARKTPTDGWSIQRLEIKQNDRKIDNWTFPKHFVLQPSHLEDLTGHNIFIRIGVGLFVGGPDPNLADIIQSEFFKVNKIELFEIDGKKQIFLDFDYNRGFPPGWKKLPGFTPEPHWVPYSMQGKVWLETDYYLIVKGEFHRVFMADKEVIKIECEYDYSTYKVPLPKKYKKINHYDFKDDKMKGVFETYTDFDLRETNPKDKKRFTLSAFGIPEPEFEPQRISRFRFFLMLFGGALTLFALWRMYKNRKNIK
jgi:hypothetical protein